MSKAGRQRRTPEQRIAQRVMLREGKAFGRQMREKMMDDIMRDAVESATPEDLAALGADTEVSETDPTEALRQRINSQLHR